MSQTFQPLTVLLVKVVLVAIAGLLITAVVAGMTWTPSEGNTVNAMNVQPIPFSHKHHAGDVGLDCRFCHVTVEKSASPGMPSAQLCLTCHSQLFSDQPLLAPLRRALESHQPIAWNHVNRLPDYVYLDHSIHVAKGVACVECHGRVDQMPLASKVQAMTMKWCIECHENPAPRLRAPRDVFKMLPTQTVNAQASAVPHAVMLEQRRRLTDCSTCHR